MIFLFLEGRHNHVISYRTLLRGLEQYGLYRRGKNINYDNFRSIYQKMAKFSMGQEVVVGIKLFGTRSKWKEFVFHERLCKCF